MDGRLGRRGLPDDGNGEKADKKNGGRPQTREEIDPSGRATAATLIRHDSIPTPNQRAHRRRCIAATTEDDVPIEPMIAE